MENCVVQSIFLSPSLHMQGSQSYWIKFSVLAMKLQWDWGHWVMCGHSIYPSMLSSFLFLVSCLVPCGIDSVLPLNPLTSFCQLLSPPRELYDFPPLEGSTTCQLPACNCDSTFPVSGCLLSPFWLLILVLMKALSPPAFCSKQILPRNVCVMTAKGNSVCHWRPLDQNTPPLLIRWLCRPLLCIMVSRPLLFWRPWITASADYSKKQFPAAPVILGWWVFLFPGVLDWPLYLYRGGNGWGPKSTLVSPPLCVGIFYDLCSDRFILVEGLIAITSFLSSPCGPFHPPEHLPQASWRFFPPASHLNCKLCFPFQLIWS